MYCLVVLVGMLLLSCDRGRQEPTSETPAGIEEEVVRGPLTVRIRADRKDLSLADRLHLTVAAEAPESYRIDLPRFGENLEQFLIRDATAVQSSLLEDDRLQLSRTYTLEPVVSGEYAIPPMEVTFTQEGQSLPPADVEAVPAEAEDVKVHRIETPPITVAVTSLLPEDVSSLEVADIVPPQELPAPPLSGVWWFGLLGAGALGVGLAVFGYRRRRHIVQAAPERPAHELAYESLRELVAEDLVATGRVKEFYQRISVILRVYIERRFDLHAPEQTTEEFLDDLGKNDVLADQHKVLLRNFLTHCDLVKFAELQPAQEDVQQTFDSCKAFIEETRQDRAEGAETGGDA